MDSLVLAPKKQELNNFIQKTSDAGEIKLALAVKWSWSRISYRQIIKLLNVSLRFISKWNNKFLTWGVRGLRIGYKGKSGYLSQSEKAEVRCGWRTLLDIDVVCELRVNFQYSARSEYYRKLSCLVLPPHCCQSREDFSRFGRGVSFV